MSTPNLYFCRAGDFLASTDEASLNFVRKQGEGEEVALKPQKVRSLPWHRRYWGLLSAVAPHLTEIDISLSDRHRAMMPITCAQDLHVALKLVSGHCITQHIKDTPYVLRIPKPTNFDEMDGTEWADYYPRVLDAIHQRALPQIDIPELREELAQFAS